MADITRTAKLVLDTTANIDSVLASAKQIQNAFKDVKIPKALEGDFNRLFAKISEKGEKVSEALTKGFTTKGDVSKFNTLTRELVASINELYRASSKLGPEAFDLGLDPKKIQAIDQEILELENHLKELSAERIEAVRKVVEQPIRKNGAASWQDFFKAFQENDLDAAGKALARLQREAEKFQTKIDNNEGTNLQQVKWQAYIDDVNKLTVQFKGLIDATTEYGRTEQRLAELNQQKDAYGTQQIEASEAALQSAIELLKQYGYTVEQVTEEQKDSAAAQANINSEMDRFKSRIQYFFGATNAVRLFRRAVNSAYETVKDLDKVMTETAVVTDFSVGDMWSQLPEYTQRANELGVSIHSAYEAATIYYQQGLKTNEVMAVSNATLKMARIAGLEAAESTDRMTNALRGFNMEITETNANRIADVYSKLAAISASNVDEISTAMTKTASLANSANMEFETTAAFLAQIIETTRESAETAGTALKTVIARFSEVKKLYSEGELLGTDTEGEEIDVNKVSVALRTAGINLNEFLTGAKGLDEVFMELASKWDTLSIVQQRYIATMAAGSRQQSRFIALMSNYARTQELVAAAQNANGASQKQYEKTLDSLETKLARLKNAWDEFTMGLANNEVIKKGIDLLTGLITTINKITGSLGDTAGGIAKLTIAIVAFIGLKQLLNSGIQKIIISMRGTTEATKEATSSFKNFTTSAKNNIKQLNTVSMSIMGIGSALLIVGNIIEKNNPKIGKALKNVGTGLLAVAGVLIIVEKAAAAANISISAALGPIGIALGVTVGLITLANSLIVTATEDLKTLDNALGNIDSSINSVNSKIEELNNTWDQLEGAKKVLDGLTEGTLEWRQQLMAVNETVLDLINKYPELSEYLESNNGRLSINEEGFKTVVETEEKRTKNMQRSKTAMQYARQVSNITATVEATLPLSKYGFGGIYSDSIVTGINVFSDKILASTNPLISNFKNLALAVKKAELAAESYVQVAVKQGITSSEFNNGTTTAAAAGTLTGFLQISTSGVKEIEDRRRALEGTFNKRTLKKMYAEQFGLYYEKGTLYLDEELQNAVDLSKETLARALAEANYEEEIRKTFENTYAKLQKEESYQEFLKIFSGEATLSELKNADFSKISDIDMSSIEQYRNQLLAQESSLKEIFGEDSKLLESLSLNLISGLSSQFENLSPEKSKAIEDLLTSFLENTKLSDKDRKQVLQELSNANWKSTNSLRKLVDSLIDLGVEIDKTELEKVVNGIIDINNAVTNLDFKEYFTSIKAIQSKILEGQIDFTEEEYRVLVDQAGFNADQFTETLEGWRYLGTVSDALDQISKSTEISLEDAARNYRNAVEQYEEAVKKAQESLEKSEESAEETKGILTKIGEYIDIAVFGFIDKLVSIAEGFFSILESLGIDIDSIDIEGYGQGLKDKYAANKKETSSPLTPEEELEQQVEVSRNDITNAINQFVTGVISAISAGNYQALLGNTDLTIAGKGGIDLSSEDLEKINAALKGALLGFDDLHELAQQYSDDLSEDEKAAWRLSAVLQLMAKQSEEKFKKLNEVIKNNVEILKNTDSGTAEYARSLSTIVKYAQAAFGNANEITADFVTSHLSEFEAMAEGDQDAINSIRQALINFTSESINEVTILDDALAYLNNSDIYVSGEANFNDIFRQLVALYGSAEEAAAMMERLGYTVNWEELPAVHNVTLPDGSTVEVHDYHAVVTDGLGNVANATRAGGGSSGGGGGGSNKSWKNPFDELYNLTEKINEALRDREKLEREYDRILKDRFATAEELRNNSLEEIANLRKEIYLQQQLLAGRRSQLQQLGNELYETEGGYKSFAEMGVTKYGSYDENTGVITIDWAAIDKITDTEEGGAVEAYIKRLEELQGQIEDVQDTIESMEDTIEEIKDRNKEGYLDFEQKVYNALVARDQKVIDEFSSLSDTIETVNNRVLDELQRSVDLERQIRDNTKTEEDIADKEARLAYLQRDTSGANALEIMQLQKDIEEARQSYEDTLIDQTISQLQDDNNRAAEQREREIELMQAQLNYNAENGAYWEKTYDLISKAYNPDGTLNNNSELVQLLGENDSFEGLSYFGKQNWVANMAQEWMAAQEGLSNWFVEDAENRGSVQLANGLSLTYDSKNKTWKDKEGNIYTDLAWDPQSRQYTAVQSLGVGTTTTTGSSSGAGGSSGNGSGNSGNGGGKTPVSTDYVYVNNLFHKVITTYDDGSKNTATEKHTTSDGYCTLCKHFISTSGPNTEYTHSEYEGAAGGFATGGSTSPTLQQIAQQGRENAIATSIRNNAIAADITKKHKFATGGLADFTGLAWLDGSKSSPELVLNPRDTENFITLKNILTQSLERGMGAFGGDNYFDIDILVDELGSDYDVDKLAERLKKQIYEDSTYRNVNTLNFIR